jgi:two-component system, cell cycle sensor histidine kinase and response regulator CckA
MAFARRQPLRPQPVDVSGVLKRLQPVIHSSMRGGVVLDTRSADESIIVEVDSVQLEQVILGLVGNGSDAMPDGGRLTISVEEVELSAGAFGPGIDVAPGRFGLITVEDTGVGMDEETRSRVFEPFFSTKPFGKGTGLGLAVVYGIVKQHGGFIFVDSELGGGTRFRLYFRSAKPSTMNEMPDRELGAARQTVLVVDDLEGIRRLIARTLRQHRYVVREASNGSDALKIARTENVSLVITDVNMPEMDGRELARRVIEQVPDIRVLVISGRIEDGGSFSFLAKPFSRSELLRRVAELLAEQRR